MSDEEQDRGRLIDEAIDLVIRLQNDPGNPVSRKMIDDWRARGSEHERAWLRVSKLYGVTGKLLEERRETRAGASRYLTRRNLIVGGAVGLGAVGAGRVIFPGVLIEMRADHLTSKGEIREVAMSDGSKATLGPESAVALDFTKVAREVRLLEGIAFFEVHRDPKRPFLVQAGELTATALGTAFDVSLDAGFVTVSVDHGMVEARAADSDLAVGERLEAGDWIAFDPVLETVDRGKRQPDQIAAWRNKLLIAEREPVAALVSRIGRWIPGRIVMADPFIGRQQVSGIFDLNDPMLAIEAVVHPTGARVRQLTASLIVISPV